MKRLCVPALLVLLTLVACGHNGATRPTPSTDLPTYSEERLIADAVGRQLHLVEGQDSIDVGIALEIAREHDKAVCMQGGGFDYVEAPIQSLVSYGPPVNIFDEKVAAEIGFGLSFVPDPALIAENPNDRTLGSLSAAGQEAWQRQIEVCETVVRESDREQTLVEYLEIVNDLYARLDADPEVLDARGIYRACMTDAGYPEAGSDLSDLYDSLFRRLAEEGGEPSTDFVNYERSIAVANARCFPPLFDVESAELAELVETADAVLYRLLFAD